MVTESQHSTVLSRRSFLRSASQLTLGLAAAAIPGTSLAAVVPGKRSLSLFHAHTNQELQIAYAWGDMYNPIALAKVTRFLLDFRTGETCPIDPRLLDILWAIQQETGRGGTYEVLSGFRSSRTNNMLRGGTNGVAEHSLHMEGKAIDIRLDGISTRQIRECAVEMKCGGVGYYAKSNFVHLDTGRYRTW